MAKKKLTNTIDLEYAFDYVEIQSPYLLGLLQEAISIIKKSVDFSETGFGPVIEGTICGYGGEVTEDGDIRLDGSILQKYERDVALALVAHELAHYHLQHYDDMPIADGSLQHDEEADRLASEWGFNIKKFRETCGPATIQTSFPK